MWFISGLMYNGCIVITCCKGLWLLWLLSLQNCVSWCSTFGCFMGRQYTKLVIKRTRFIPFHSLPRIRSTSFSGHGEQKLKDIVIWHPMHILNELQIYTWKNSFRCKIFQIERKKCKFYFCRSICLGCFHFLECKILYLKLLPE